MNKKRIAIGIEIRTAPAAKLVYQLSMYSFSNIFQSPIAIVYWSEFARQITFAKMKSSHGAIKDVSTVYTMMGLLSGSVILLKICHLVHPSKSAASSIATGIVSKNPLQSESPVPRHQNNTKSETA